MKQARVFVRSHYKQLIACATGLVFLAALYLYKLGSLVGGLSSKELIASAQPVGWSGIYTDPLFLPLKIVRSIVFAFSPDHGQTLTRLPNVTLGLVAVISCIVIIKFWHGWRTAVLAGLLFSTSAWTLHASRLASNDVVYLCAIPALLLTNLLINRYYQKPIIIYGSLLVWGLLLYVPGMIWLLAASIYTQRKALRVMWQSRALLWQKALYVVLIILWLPLLVMRLTNIAVLKNWLGFPAHLASSSTLVKQIVAVPVHLFIRGPQYPDIWLARMPIIDILGIVIVLCGIYFYSTNAGNSRSRLLAYCAVVGALLVGLGGPVGLSLLIPLLYIVGATGLTFLLHEWLKVFPANPLARSLGIGLLSIAVLASCTLNLRAYFIAWPHSPATRLTFQNHR